jgi:amino acid transporter
MSSSQPAAPQESSSSQIGMWDAVSIIVGIIIGAAIFASPPGVFYNSPETWSVFGRTFTLSPAWGGMLAWLLVGILSLIGALCYAELGTTYPTTGGDYTYISRAYGHGPGFVFAWAEMSIIRTGGSIAAMAYVFAEYADSLLHNLAGPIVEGAPPANFYQSIFVHLGKYSQLTFAAVPIVFLTLINALGLKPGKWTQNLLALVKVLGVLGIVATGALSFLWPRTAEDALPLANAQQNIEFKVANLPPPTYALALVFVFYAYGGWNEAAYVAAELRNRRRNLILALMIGVGAVTLIYLAVNGAYLTSLGLTRVQGSKAIAADVMKLSLGKQGAIAISILIMISALGAINGLLFTGVRLYSNFGQHERLFAWLSRRRPGGVPYGALFIQTFFSLALISLLETSGIWKPWVAPKLSQALNLVNIGLPGKFMKTDKLGFDDIVTCTAPVFWLFFTLSGYALIVLRSRDRNLERPFRVPLYPILPIIFCLSSLFMLYKSTTWALFQSPAEIMVVGLFLLLGIPLYALSGSSSAKPSSI